MILRANELVGALFASPADGLVGELLPALMAPADKGSLERVLQKFQIGDRKEEWLGLAVPASGSPFQVALTAALGRHPDESVYRIPWSVRDVGLELDDVSFDRGTVTFRPHPHRRLKTRTSWRVVPLFPQLAEILRSYVLGPRLERGGKLLFPSFATGQEAMLVDVRKLVDRIAGQAGWKDGELTTRVFRHTWTAARLQTLDRGAPVSLYTGVPDRAASRGAEGSAWKGGVCYPERYRGRGQGRKRKPRCHSR